MLFVTFRSWVLGGMLRLGYRMDALCIIYTLTR
jgi:hypothetical protein